MRFVSDISNVDNLFCEPASPKAVRGLSGPSRNSLGAYKGRTTRNPLCKELNTGRFVFVAAVGTASFGNHLR